jgi:hypothetical protein
MTLIHFFAHITEGDFRDHFHDFLLILLAVGVAASGVQGATELAEGAGSRHSPGRTPAPEPA